MTLSCTSDKVNSQSRTLVNGRSRELDQKRALKKEIIHSGVVALLQKILILKDGEEEESGC